MGRRALRLTTERLTIRPLARHDVTPLTTYRNDPEVARYQDWELPYTRDLAHALVDHSEQAGAPIPGEWVQLAIADELERLLGDVAVWIDDAGQLAMIGYTLAPASQGKGYASEAVACVLDYLFSVRRIHRVAATLDPANVASARVLERNGFRFVGIAKSAAYVRGEWADDARFELLAGEWRDWKRRRPVKRVRLIEIERSNARAVGALDRGFSQRRFVASVHDSYADALLTDPRPWMRAIEADGQLAGFMMVARPNEERAEPYLWRFMIDWRFQGRGVGRTAIRELAALEAAAGSTHLRLSYVPDLPGTPGPFYRKLGFRPTGEINEWGEVEMTAPLVTLLG